MNHRFLASMSALGVVTVLVLLTPILIAGQAPLSMAKTRTPPRTPDGKPDLQGIWTNATVTPLERPRDLAGKEFLTQTEAAEFEKQAVYDANGDRRDGTADADVGRAYNEFWRDRGKVVSAMRTSLIVDPGWKSSIVDAGGAEEKRRSGGGSQTKRWRLRRSGEPIFGRALSLDAAGWTANASCELQQQLPDCADSWICCDLGGDDSRRRNHPTGR